MYLTWPKCPRGVPGHFGKSFIMSSMNNNKTEEYKSLNVSTCHKRKSSCFGQVKGHLNKAYRININQRKLL